MRRRETDITDLDEIKIILHKTLHITAASQIDPH